MKSTCLAFSSLAVAVGLLSAGPVCAQSTSRHEVTHYQDDFENWILGHADSVTINGVTSENRTFDRGRLVQLRIFGRLVQQLEYRADGTLMIARDGNGNATILGEWKRGIPQQIGYPDGTTTSAQVDDNGRIVAVTDQSGFTTTYGHDAMGRLTRVDYPADSTTTWSSLHSQFEQVAAEEMTLAPGHWRQTVSRGDARRVTYFDALWRPVVTQEFDAADQSTTQRFTRRGYDHDGREIFSSYPSSNPAAPLGIGKSFDVLGRATGTVQDSELGALVTVVDYLQTGIVRTTDPRGQVTLSRFQQFGEPTYEYPISMELPEGTATHISRDVFGKTLAIGRSSSDGTVALQRFYVYDAYQLLCKQIEPESGATVTEYDGAGNLVRSASGVDAPSSTDCNRDVAAASGRAITRTYDTLGRLRTLLFPDGNGDQTFDYTPDGLPQTIVTANDGGTTHVTNTYEYNSRRLVSREQLDAPQGVSWSMAYAYTPNGHLATERFPGGLEVDYAPNAMGQASRAGSFATNVTYHPDGSIKQFTYGNGIVRTLEVNARGLRSRTLDAGVLDVTATYDGAGNPISFRDGIPGTGTFQNDRDMQYDGLDRLVHVNVHGRLQERFTYDALDNRTASGRLVAGEWNDQTYLYDDHNRLTNVRGPDGGTIAAFVYDPQGNLTQRSGETFEFDYGNRLRTSAGATYRYDGYGRRVASELDNGETELSLYGQDGRLRYQRSLADNTQRNYIAINGMAIARVIDDTSGGDPEPTPAPSAAPVLSGPVSSTGQIDLTWTSVAGATRYQLEEHAGLGWSVVQSTAATAWGTTGKAVGTYEYRVSACNATGCGPASSPFVVPVSALPPPPPPASVTLKVERLDWDQISALRWTASEGATSYELKMVFIGSDHEQFETLPMTLVRIWNHTRGDPIVLAYYYVRACSPSGCSSWVMANGGG
ncbi:RHS repeat protein [Stenotrophomonas sp.]|uniref:RHS repeat domain-containing protein n=1 Tax=Stenotrophomonas sp. TaxID=69392 RepID=UPI0028AEC3F8|nr:RHS repeat protein [Stenotrophomonas sp.]